MASLGVPLAPLQSPTSVCRALLRMNQGKNRRFISRALSVHGPRRHRGAPAVQQLRVSDSHVGGKRQTMPRISRNGSSGVGQRPCIHRWYRRITHTLRCLQSQTLHSPLLRPSEPIDRPRCHRDEGPGPLVTRRAGHAPPPH